MPKKHNFFSYFLALFFLSIVIFAASKIGLLKPFDSLAKGIVSPVQALTYGIYSRITNLGTSSEVKDLKNQNIQLTQKLINQNKLIEDNKALRDQFQVQNPKSSGLLEADVVAAPGFIPGISMPEILILDRGENDGIKAGQAVVYQDNLVGSVLKTSKYLSSVLLVTNFSSSFTAKTSQTDALGVAKGQGGGGVFLDNVVLSDTLQKGDLVLTKGDYNNQGVGVPPDLVIGQIDSVSKFPSDLFQEGKLKSKLDFTRLSKVFVILTY
jgi:rod shape-determining protein MreC